MKVNILQEITEEPVVHNEKILKKVLIRKGEIPNITQFARAVFPPGETAAGHIHQDMYEVFLTEKGNGLMEIDGQKIPMEPGTCITVEPGEMHEVKNTENGNLIVLILGILKN